MDATGKIIVAVFIGLAIIYVLMERASQADYREFCREIAGNNLAAYEECVRAPGADHPGSEYR